MAGQQGRQRRPAAEMFEALSEMALDLFGDDDNAAEERDNYVTSHMKKLGYRARVIFEDAGDDDGNNGGDSFTSSLFGNGQRQRRDVGGGGRSQRRASGGFGSGQYS
jgi:hypothetical protein